MPRKTKKWRFASRKGLIHGIAQCKECDWCESDYLTVQKRAAQHARATGHKVIADLGYVVEYGGNGKTKL